MSEPIQVGDVALDKTQGRPVHIVEDCGQTAAEWSEANGYDLEGNYGNSRLGTTPEDAVYEVVYCSNAKSEPSKTYAMPESRLLRIETEAADDGRPVAERIIRETLEKVFDSMHRNISLTEDNIDAVAMHLGDIDPDLVDEARELADVAHTVGGEDAE